MLLSHPASSSLPLTPPLCQKWCSCSCKNWVRHEPEKMWLILHWIYALIWFIALPQVLTQVQQRSRNEHTGAGRRVKLSLKAAVFAFFSSFWKLKIGNLQKTNGPAHLVMKEMFTQNKQQTYLPQSCIWYKLFLDSNH